MKYAHLMRKGFLLAKIIILGALTISTVILFMRPSSGNLIAVASGLHLLVTCALAERLHAAEEFMSEAGDLILSTTKFTHVHHAKLFPEEIV